MAAPEWTAPPPWLGPEGETAGDTGAGRILFTRFLRRRNFRGFSFWVSCAPEICREVAARARSHAASAGFQPAIALADCAPEVLGLFRERQWLPERPTAFPGKREFKLLFLGRPWEHAWVGEVEHWTQVSVRPGLPAVLDPLPPELENPQAFSHSASHGFLTSHPGFCGSGLQIECGLHLPGLSARNRIPQAQKALNALGLDLQPLSWRAAGSSEAGFFRVLTRGGMGFSEESFYRRFEDIVKSLVRAEKEALERWREEGKTAVEDKVFRAQGLLREARSLSYPEFLTFSSFARAGAYLGLFPGGLTNRLEDLRVRAQPFHVQAAAGIDAEEGDKTRAAMVRSELGRWTA